MRTAYSVSREYQESDTKKQKNDDTIVNKNSLALSWAWEGRLTA